MLGSSNLVAFVPSAGLGRARAFYEHTLGLPVVEQTHVACVLNANGTMVRVTEIPDFSPAHYTVLGWRVTDIQAAARDLVSKGVVFERYAGLVQDESGIWTSPDGDQVAWFTDPDGNILSLTQPR